MAQLIKTFYPYDPLAAAELNQIVSFLNGTAAGTNIEDEAILHRHLAPNSVESGNINFATLSFGNYSTSEVDTGFKWTNGDAIYKKTVVVTGRPAGSSNVPHGIVGLKMLVKYEGAYTATTGSRNIVPVVLSEAGTSQWQTAVTVDNTNIVTNRVAGPPVDYHITLWYTKV